MTHSFRAAVEARDIDGLRAALHPNVILRSPVVHEPYRGRDDVVALLGHVGEVLEDFRYTDELTGVDSVGLVFRARIGDRDLQGLDFLRVDHSGLVTELVVMMRPLTGLLAVAEAMSARLASSG